MFIKAFDSVDHAGLEQKLLYKVCLNVPLLLPVQVTLVQGGFNLNAVFTWLNKARHNKTADLPLFHQARSGQRE